MKPLLERQQYVDYMTGKQMPASAFNSGALDIFASYTWPDVLKEHCTRQLDFDGEVWYQKTRPIELKSGEQLHLEEVRTPKQGITQSFEAVQIEAIRAELSTL